MTIPSMWAGISVAHCLVDAMPAFLQWSPHGAVWRKSQKSQVGDTAKTIMTING